MMEHIAQEEGIQFHLSPMHLFALSEVRNVKVEILDQSMTSHQSTGVMNEKTSHLHYSTLTGMIEDDMWIIDNGDSRHMMGYQARLSNLNENKTSHKVEIGDKRTYPIKGIGQASIKF
jgi:hypothetical protein